MIIDKLDIDDIYSQYNKESLMVSKINEIIKEQNNIGTIIDDKIIYHTSHIDDDITEIEQKYHDLNLKINELINTRYQCEKAEPRFALNKNEGTSIIMEAEQLKHMINTLTLLIDELINNIQ